METRDYKRIAIWISGCGCSLVREKLVLAGQSIFYPLWFGGKGWDAYQTATVQFMGSSYGPRDGLLGFLLLPLDLFLYPIGHFGPIPFAFPPLFSLLLPCYLLLRRQQSVDWILFIA